MYFHVAGYQNQALHCIIIEIYTIENLKSNQSTVFQKPAHRYPLLKHYFSEIANTDTEINGQIFPASKCVILRSPGVLNSVGMANSCYFFTYCELLVCL